MIKIYLAGFYVGGRAMGNNAAGTSENLAILSDLKYPYLLESYHYVRGTRFCEAFRNDKVKIFLDSGAFSMFTQGIEVNLEEYADYLKANADWVDFASNIDEIGKGKEQESYNNQKELERLGVRVNPVHHARDDDKWLQKYLAEGYDYIFLGGMVPESTPYLRGWLDHLWEKYLTRKDGSAKIKVHGFGLTTTSLLERYPWYSVDSTAWLMGRFGPIALDLPDGRIIKVNMSESSPSVHRIDGHFDTLSEPNKRVVEARVRELGFDPELLRTHYGWRDRFNIEFYRRLGERLSPTFHRKQIGVFD